MAYGGVVVVGAAILLARFLSRLTNRDSGHLQTIFELILLSALLVVPYMVWWGTVTIITGKFYSDEIERWHQVVWILDVTRNGWPWLLSKLASNFGFFITSTLHHLISIFPLMLLMALFSWPHRTELAREFRNDALLLYGATSIAALFLVFYTLVGYQVSRLAMPIAVMAIVGLGAWARHLDAILGKAQKLSFVGSTAALVTAQAIWIVVKDGPYF